MIAVIKIDRKKILLVVLVVVGVILCAVGFGGLAEKLVGLRDKSSTAATVTLTHPENGGSAVGNAGPGEAQPFEQVTFDDIDNLSDSSYFVEARMSLERARGKEMETLREVLDSEADEEVRKTAQERLMNLSGIISQEMELENLIRAKGYRDAAVFLDSDTVTLILSPGKDMVADADSTAIAGLVAKTTGVPEDGVIVITREN